MQHEALKNRLLFVTEFFREFDCTGSVCPTSSKAATALTKPLREQRCAKNVLEVGPGTGSVTVKILRDMRPGDNLTICEINPRFMRELKKRLADNPDFLQHRDQITFFQGPIQELSENQHFDVIVCALPFLNFERAMVAEIFSKLMRLSSKDTVMTYYEYIGLRSLGKVVSFPTQKRRFKELDEFFDDVYSHHLRGRKRVWWNFLPINIYTLDLRAGQAA